MLLEDGIPSQSQVPEQEQAASTAAPTEVPESPPADQVFSSVVLLLVTLTAYVDMLATKIKNLLALVQLMKLYCLKVIDVSYRHLDSCLTDWVIGAGNTSSRTRPG